MARTFSLPELPESAGIPAFTGLPESAGLLESARIPALTGLFEILDGAVQSGPDRTAVRFPGGSLAYARLRAVVDGAASALAAQGIGRGSVVALWSDNRLQGVVAILALARLGAQAAPLSPRMTATEVGALLTALAPDALAVGDGMDQDLPPVRRVHVPVESTAAFAGVAPGPDEVALILFTAGSTGVPKSVPLTHRNLAASVSHIVGTYRLSPRDATLLAMPLSHGHGLIAGLLSTLASGGTVTLPAAGHFSAHSFAAELRSSGATWYTASPTMHRIILMHGGPFPRLRFVRSCSEALPVEVASQLAEAFHGPVVPAYGMTETSHQACSNPLPEDGTVVLSTVGRPTGVEISIRRPDGTPVGAVGPSAGTGGTFPAAGGPSAGAGQSVGAGGSFVGAGGSLLGRGGAPTGIGEEGEIWIRGDAVSAGYRNATPGEDAVFAGGWFRTGDLGFVDAAGYVTVSGRLKDIIDRGGEKISPTEVEQALLTNPAVAAAVAFGVPDPVYGEHVSAAVVARPGLVVDVAALLAEAKQNLPSAAVPNDIRVLPELPLTHKGTVDRRALVRSLESRP